MRIRYRIMVYNNIDQTKVGIKNIGALEYVKHFFFFF